MIWRFSSTMTKMPKSTSTVGSSPSWMATRPATSACRFRKHRPRSCGLGATPSPCTAIRRAVASTSMRGS